MATQKLPRHVRPARRPIQQVPQLPPLPLPGYLPQCLETEELIRHLACGDAVEHRAAQALERVQDEVAASARERADEEHEKLFGAVRDLLTDFDNRLHDALEAKAHKLLNAGEFFVKVNEIRNALHAELVANWTV
jgi:hypothetical protein